MTADAPGLRTLLQLRGSTELPRGAAFGLLPEQLAELGVVSSAAFGQLQRPWTWDAGAPRVGQATRVRLGASGLKLPDVVSSAVAADGSTKLVLQFDGDRIEAVHMPRKPGTARATLCLSSQVGCAMGCSFCATAKMGFRRQLASSEIVAQVLRVLLELGPRHPGDLTLVFMGMGEPLHNLPQVARAIEILCHPSGLGLSPRRVTVSTSGLVPEIEALAGLPVRPLLALSLNATTDALRSELMPVNRRYPLALLRETLTRYPVRARERITIEYVLLAGINDSAEDAWRLADFCEPFAHNINLIPWNAHSLSAFRSPTEDDINRFAQALLLRRPALLTVRRSRGRDVGAACGQLVQDLRERPPLRGVS